MDVMAAIMPIGLIKRLHRDYLRHNIPEHAAALSFYALLSIAPVIILLNILLASLGGSSAVRNVLGEIGVTRNPLLEIAALLFLLYAATRAFLQLQQSLNAIWRVPQPSVSGLKANTIFFVKRRLMAFLLILFAGIILSLIPLANAALTIFGKNIFTTALMILVILLVMTLLFFVIFRTLPDRKPSWLWRGSFITAVFFLLGQVVLAIFIQNLPPLNIYGTAGSIVVIMLWLYYSAQVMLSGALLIAIMGERKKPR